MKIGYNKLIVSLPVLLAALLAGLTIYVTNLGKPVDQNAWFIVAGLLVISVPMYFVPYIVVTEKEIIVNNQFGMPRRRRSITGLKDIRFEKGKLMVKENGEFRKLYLSKILADGKGLKALKLATDAA